MTRSASTSDDRPVARLSSPGEIVGAVPHLCGFTPTESVVALSLRGERARVGLTLRFDLPGPAAEEQVADELAARLRADGARRTVVVVYTETAGAGGDPGAGGLLRQRFVDLVRRACRQRGVDVDDALLVREQRWVSYLCRDAACCPRGGTPTAQAAGSAALGLVAAEQVAEGRAVLGSRDELAASIAPPVLLARTRALQRLALAEAEHAADRLARGRQAVLTEAVDRFRQAVDRYGEPPAHLDGDEAALLAVALHDVLVRDEVATWSLHERGPLLGLLTDLARATAAPFDAPVCTLLAWVAYAGGDGGLANVALERVLATSPDYALALLLRQALDAQVPPAQVRRVLRGTRSELRRRRRSR